MGLSERSASSLGTIMGQVERVCSVAEEATPPPGDRSGIKFLAKISKKYGLDPIDSKAPCILTLAELKEFCEPLDKLILSAQEEIEQLYEVVREAGYTVLSCDSSGVAVAHRGEHTGKGVPILGNLARRGVVRGGGGHKRHRHLHRSLFAEASILGPDTLT